MASWRTPTTTCRSRTRSAPDGTFGTGDLEGKGEAYTRQALEAFRKIGDERGEANALWGLGTLHLLQDDETGGEPEFRQALELFRKAGDRTMEAWALPHAGLRADPRRGGRPRRGTRIDHAITHFHAAGDVAGLTLTLFDLSSVAVQAGDLERAARLRGAAANISTETGARLADDDRGRLRARWRAPVGADELPPEDIERLGAEGAAMTLDEAVAYALEGAPAAAGTPFDFDAAGRPQPILILDGRRRDPAAADRPMTRSGGP